jgi:hypothetical protein
MGLLDNPLDRHAVENLRRSIAMLATGQVATLERDRALRLLEELQRLQHEHQVVAAQLHAVLDRLEAG